MADLLDIAPSTSVRAVMIRGEPIDVRGLSFNDAAFIVSRFPDVGKLLAGGISEAAIIRLIERLGTAVGAVIAAGCSRLGDEKYEHAASNSFVMDEQAALVDAIWALTFPNGVGSFVEMMKRLFGVAGEGAKVKVRLRTSPSASPPSSDADSRPNLQ